MEKKSRRMRKSAAYVQALLLAALMFLSSCSSKEYSSYELAGGAGGVFSSGEEESGARTEGENSGEDSDEEMPSIFGRVTKKKNPDSDGGAGKEGGTGTETGGESGSGTGTDDEYEDIFVINEGPNAAYQLTEEDIQKMNGNKAVIVRSNNGYVSTLVGKYYDRKIQVIPNDIRTFESAINSLNGVATLLGFRAGTEFLAYEGSQDKEGYTYLTYLQRYGETTVTNATMHIVIDPEGYPCAVSCSFAPELGFSSETSAMTAQQAENLIQGFLAQYGYGNLQIYRDATVKAAIPVYTQIHNCYIVFTDNPEGISGFENLRYCKWFVSMETDIENPILMMLASSTLTADLDNSYYSYDEYFENLEPVTWSGQLDFMNDGGKNVEVTVSYNTLDGKYYMIDPVRKIAVADCYEFLYGSGSMDFLSNTRNSWSERDLVAMYDYEAAYDAYAKIGIKSPDGYETPVLLLRGYCDENRQPVNNACYMAQFQGWFTFCYSDANDMIYDLDVIGHEYTHAVTESCIQGNNYMNDAGAINEAYSDIMGNLIELMAGRTKDTLWLNGENSNEAVRQMSDPTVYHQPDCVGGPYYVPNVEYAIQGFNDNGGVHINSGIVNYAAYLMYKSGMDYATMFDIFYTSMNILTPANSFEDVYAALIYSARSNGYTGFEQAIMDAFTSVGVTGTNRLVQEMLGASGRSEFGTLECLVFGSNSKLYAVAVYDAVTENYITEFWPDRTGTLRMTMAEGYYYLQMMELDLYTGNMARYLYTDNGWEAQVTGDPVVYVTPGETAKLYNFQ